MIFIRVFDDVTSFLLTTYRRFSDDTAPELRIRAVQQMSQAELRLVDTQTQQGRPAEIRANLAVSPCILLVHAERVGDIQAGGDEWTGAPDRDRAIEGFSVRFQHELSDVDLEYAGTLGRDWTTPWAQAGAFCGSRGMSLPLLGFTMRLFGPSAERFSCTYWGAFADGTELGPISGGMPCLGTVPLTAMRIQVSARADRQQAPSPAPTDRARRRLR
jgi:hypothetical protein